MKSKEKEKRRQNYLITERLPPTTIFIFRNNNITDNYVNLHYALYIHIYIYISISILIEYTELHLFNLTLFFLGSVQITYVNPKACVRRTRKICTYVNRFVSKTVCKILIQRMIHDYIHIIYIIYSACTNVLCMYSLLLYCNALKDWETIIKLFCWRRIIEIFKVWTIRWDVDCVWNG